MKVYCTNIALEHDGFVQQLCARRHGWERLIEPEYLLARTAAEHTASAKPRLAAVV